MVNKMTVENVAYKDEVSDNFFLKQELSDAHGILAMLNLDDHTYTHLSAKMPGRDAFYLTPFGLCFEEVEAQELLQVSFEGNLLGGKSQWLNQTGYVIHRSIYVHNPDIQAVFHLHTPETVAVSALKEGLLPLSQWALHFYNQVTYHAYDSLALNETQGQALARDLSNYPVLFLKHHGIITVGRTIQEALFYTYHLQKACETQCKLLAMNQEYDKIPAALCDKTVKDLLSFEENLGARDWQAWIRKLKRWQGK